MIYVPTILMVLKKYYNNIRDVSENLVKGVIGQNLYRFVTPEVAVAYDYVIILYDDIEISKDVDFSVVYKNYLAYNIDIFSLSLSTDSKFSHEIMLQESDSNQIRMLNMLEIFFYFMSSHTYTQYYSLLDEMSSWLWGVDFALHKMGFKCGIIDKYTMKHYYIGASYSPYLPDANVKMAYNKEKFNNQNFTQEVLERLPLLI